MAPKHLTDPSLDPITLDRIPHLSRHGYTESRSRRFSLANHVDKASTPDLLTPSLYPLKITPFLKT
jgi:hypothetical protein